MHHEHTEWGCNLQSERAWMYAHLFVRFCMAKKRSRSYQVLRIAGLILVSLLVLFFLFDDIIMPLYTQQGNTTRVPNVTGLTLDEASRILEGAGLDPKESETKPDRTYPIGAVSYQNPPSGSIVKFGRGVYLTVSGGDIMVDVPTLRGRSLRDATFALEGAGLILGAVTYQPSSQIFMNTVISQSIEPGEKIKTGSSIGVIVSQGKPGEKRSVPNIVMKSRTEAEKMLLQSGFTLGMVTEQPNVDLLPNTVMDQYPKAGFMAPFGQQIDIFVAVKGEAPPELEN